MSYNKKKRNVTYGGVQFSFWAHMGGCIFEIPHVGGCILLLIKMGGAY